MICFGYMLGSMVGGWSWQLEVRVVQGLCFHSTCLSLSGLGMLSGCRPTLPLTPLSCHLGTRVALCGAPGLLSLLSSSRLSYFGHFLGTSVAFGGCPEPQSPTQLCWKEQLRERAAPAWSGIGVSLALSLATALS